jgi:hypothetical protein
MMTREEARQLLEMYRPGGADDEDPRFREALEWARRDAALGAWLEGQRAFDRVMVAAVRSTSVPADLKAALLSSRRPVVREAAVWWRPSWGDWRVRAALAAAIVFLASVAGVFSQRGPSRFTEFRREMVEEAWNGESHVDFRSKDLFRIKQWLARNGGPTKFQVPEALIEQGLHGCSVVRVGGHAVAVLCLASGTRHVHLFVAEDEDMQFVDLPREGTPDFEKCGLWKTASWRGGGHTYVLTGMNYPTFVSTFRRGGRWTISG